MSAAPDDEQVDALRAPRLDAEPSDIAQIPDVGLRSALEFAVSLAAAGQKLRPPLEIPAGLKPLLRLTRLDRAALVAARRAVAADDTFRDRLGQVVTSELVDELGVVWLQRGDGWPQRALELQAQARDQVHEKAGEAALRKAERRREAAEQMAARAQAELIAMRESADRERRTGLAARDRVATLEAQIESLRAEMARLARDHATISQRVVRESDRADRADEVAAALRQDVRDAQRLRDELLAARAVDQPPSDVVVDGERARRDDDVAQAARTLQRAIGATQELAALLAAAGAALEPRLDASPPVVHEVTSHRHRRAVRKPIAIPGGIYGDSLAAATHLVRTARVCVLVDGYNVAKLGWPQLTLVEQRERCIEMLEDLARRFGTDIGVIFDGADVVGASAGRRLVRVRFSPPGVSADDVIRDEVRGLPANTPVVVATNDQAIISDVRVAGANVVSSEMLLAVGGRQIAR